MNFVGVECVPSANDSRELRNLESLDYITRYSSI